MMQPVRRTSDVYCFFLDDVTYFFRRCRLSDEHQMLPRLIFFRCRRLSDEHQAFLFL